MTNTEHEFIEADEQSRAEELFDPDITRMQNRIEAKAKAKAEKFLKKNRREIARLKKHAGECLLKNEKFGYCYAIKKLRDFYKQPYTEELIEQMWNSSRAAMFDIAAKAKETNL